jgi:phosphatidylglycerophosphate synthase
VKQRAPQHFLLTPPQLLTGARLLAGPGIVAALAGWGAGWALAVFALAVVTDFLDGRLARARGEASAAGAFFDHVCDAWFVTWGLGACAWRSALTPWLPALILVSFLEYSWDYLRGGAPLRGSAIGRINGIAYYVLLGGLLSAEALGRETVGDQAARLGGGILVLSTLVSIAARWRNRRALAGVD